MQIKETNIQIRVTKFEKRGGGVGKSLKEPKIWQSINSPMVKNVQKILNHMSAHQHYDWREDVYLKKPKTF